MAKELTDYSNSDNTNGIMGVTYANSEVTPMEDYSKRPTASSRYVNMRGVVDFGNLLQFAPFEGGYCFLAVINAPYMATTIGDNYFTKLQNTFVAILENEFRGLSGIDDITADTIDVTDGISTLSLLGKVNQATNSQLSMTFTEKTGTPITTYLSNYLRFIRDPRTQAKTYGGKITASNAYSATAAKEVFNMLYIITDSTCLNIEKAFLLLNAQPTSAGYGDIYTGDKGDISSKEVTVNWNAFVVDGKLPNKIAHVYMRNLVANDNNKKGKIKLNSYDYDWSISGLAGGVSKSSNLRLNPNTGKFSWNPKQGVGFYEKDKDGTITELTTDAETYISYAGEKEDDKKQYDWE